MLEVRSLCAGYGAVPVLHDVSLVVPEGRLVALIGANGAGKTTTMRALSGMIRPSAGQVRLDGQDITGQPSHRVARAGLAHSPEGRRVFPTLPVVDNLLLGAFPRLAFGARHAVRPGRPAVEEDLERVFGLFPRLRERAQQAAGTLSGGEQQMLAMGRALMLRPRVLLLDEPSMGLAPRLVAEVFATLARLKAEGITMLLVEQFAAAALRVADYGYVLESGRIRVEGEAAQLADDPAVREAYLGAAH